MTTDPFQVSLWSVGFRRSVAVIAGLILLVGISSVSALAGFMIVGPLLAIGLYEEPEACDRKRSSLAQMILFGQNPEDRYCSPAFSCVCSCSYGCALPLSSTHCSSDYNRSGLDHIATMLFTTPVGLTMLAVGGAIGACLLRFLSQSVPFQSDAIE